MSNEFLERKIIIGLVTSTEYLHQVQSVFETKYLQSQAAERLAQWCLEYFKKYRKAPNIDIEDIYYQKLKEGLPQEIAEELEEDILPELSEEYEEDGLNVTYLTDQTFEYLNERHLQMHTEQVDALRENGELREADLLASSYAPLVKNTAQALDLATPLAVERLREAFKESYHPVIEYPKQLGAFWNHQLSRGKFVALQAPEKRGKTFLLLDMCMRACKQGKNVVFFQAGDMTEKEQLKRVSVRLAKKSDLEKYSGPMYQPTRDCILNQMDECSRPERECNFGPFAGMARGDINELTLEQLLDAYEEHHKEYAPCFNCKEYKSHSWGAPWLKYIDTGDPLTVEEAIQVWEKYFHKYEKQFKMSTHANGTLSVDDIYSYLELWDRQENWLPDLIVIDYADLLVCHTRIDFRHQQNEIWKGMRRLSQEKNQPLVVTATQSNAGAYSKDRMSLENFSEDKRKYAHVTAMYGLNQDTKGREKSIGLLYINELLLREGSFDSKNGVYVLQNLRRGLPAIESYF